MMKKSHAGMHTTCGRWLPAAGHPAGRDEMASGLIGRTRPYPTSGPASIPIAQHRRQQVRRLAFGQAGALGEPQLPQQRDLLLRGRLLAPRRLGLDQPRHAQVPRIVFRQPLGIDLLYLLLQMLSCVFHQEVP